MLTVFPTAFVARYNYLFLLLVYYRYVVSACLLFAITLQITKYSAHFYADIEIRRVIMIYLSSMLYGICSNEIFLLKSRRVFLSLVDTPLGAEHHNQLTLVLVLV